MLFSSRNSCAPRKYPWDSDWRVGYIQSVRPSVSTWDAYRIALAVDVYAPRQWRMVTLACIEEESKFRQGVVGDDGRSLGLMQVQMKTAQCRWKHIDKDLLCRDTNTNIRVGVWWLRVCGWNPQIYNAGANGAKRGKGRHHLWKVSQALERMETYLMEQMDRDAIKPGEIP